MTRLQSFFPQHETTDDTTNIDYDYSLEDDESSDEPTHFTLPLVPILNDNESSLSTVNEPASSTSSTVQYEIELNEYSFRQTNGTDSPSTASPSVVIDLLNQQPETAEDRNALMNSTSVDLSTSDGNEESSSTDQPDENSSASPPPHPNEEGEKNVNSSENDTTTAESLASLEQTETESPEPRATTTIASPDSRDISDLDEDDNYSTTSREFVAINKSEGFDERAEADKTISNRSDTTAIHLDGDYLDTILLNDSLLIDESSSYENTTDVDYDVTTITAFSPPALADSEESTNGSSEKRVESTTDVDRVITSTADFQLFPTTATTPTTATANSRIVEEFTTRDNDFPYENRIIKDDQQDSNSEGFDETSRFVYHHLPATDSASNEDVLATSTTVVRFPTDAREAARSQRVRFPDEFQPKNPPPKSMSFAWPRESGFHQSGGVMRFWQEQPLINDYKFNSRGNSRAPSGSLNVRPMSYRRNYR